MKNLSDPLKFFDAATIDILSDESVETKAEIKFISKIKFKAIYEDNSSIECELKEI